MAGFALEARAVDEAALLRHQPGLWRIASKGTLRRWVEIHNLEEARTSRVFHIEVLGRESGRPPWDVKHLCPHMAISLEALSRSVLTPLEHGSVYPESFEAAFAAWRKQAQSAEPIICRSTVIECLVTSCSARSASAASAHAR